MATIVCHQQQQQQQSSFVEAHLVEPRTTLRLRLSPSPLITPPQNNNNNNNKCHNLASATTNSVAKNGGWSFLQSFADESATATKKLVGETTTTIYVHPLNKRSSAKILNEKSLQLCTENLGNETGTTDDDSFDSANSGEVSESFRRRSPARRTRVGPRNFPPPLTTMAGKDSIQVKTHRQEGRLLITAVKGQSRLVSCFKADRSEEGRLRLCLVQNYDQSKPVFDSEKETLEEEEVKEEREEEGESEKICEKRGEIGIIEKYGIKNRGGRCKESGDQHYIGEKNKKSVLNWEPFWVTT